jgi:hypothetical protein
VIASILVLGTINWQLTAVLLVVVSVLGRSSAGWLRAAGELHQSFAGQAAHVSGDLTDVVSNIGLVRAFGAAQREQQRLSVKIADEMQAQRPACARWSGCGCSTRSPCSSSPRASWCGRWSSGAAGQISTGDVVLTTTLGFTVLHASRDFAMALVDMVQQFAKLARRCRCSACRMKCKMRPMPSRWSIGGGSIEFRNVSFSYPSGQQVLDHFDLHVPAGRKSAWSAGPGAGKSTIIALLQRLYDPGLGLVCIDGQDIAHVTQVSLRSSIAVVQQDISLFHRSLLENLRYGRPEASDEEVYRAVEAARCTEFISRLPRGLRHPGRRARHEIVRRPAPAAGHCARLSDERPHRAARRSDLGARHRIRAVHPRGLARLVQGTHGDRHRASPVDARCLRSHRGARSRPHRRGRRAPGGVVGSEIKAMPVAVMSILGVKVQGPKGEDLGRVVDVMADASGRVRIAIIDFGGFLGVGDRRIAVEWPLLRFSPADPSSVVLRVERDKLKALPEYKGAERPQVLMALPPPATPPAGDGRQ